MDRRCWSRNRDGPIRRSDTHLYRYHEARWLRLDGFPGLAGAELKSVAHIAVELRRTHGGGAIETLLPRGANVGGLLPKLESMAYPLLRLVDPYDVTEFSSNQMIGLVPEL